MRQPRQQAVVLLKLWMVWVILEQSQAAGAIPIICCHAA
jgi:hypothetical protein